MNQLAIVVLGAAALLVHLVLMLLATPLLASGEPPRPVPGRLRTGWRSLLADPVRELAALAAKETVRSDGASALSAAIPVASLGFTAAAALLVPSFATAMLDSPLADLPLILALLAGGRLVWLVGACDSGAAWPGLAAMGSAVNGLLVLPALVLAASVLFLLSGSTVLDTMLSAQRGLASVGGIACAAALALAALAAGGRSEALSQDLSGPDLVLFRIENGLQRLVWIDLVGGLVWPGSLAPAQSGPLFWLLGLLAWFARLAFAVVVLALLRDRLRSTEARRRLAGLSLLAAVLSPILLLAGQGGG